MPLRFATRWRCSSWGTVITRGWVPRCPEAAVGGDGVSGDQRARLLLRLTLFRQNLERETNCISSSNFTFSRP